MFHVASRVNVLNVGRGVGGGGGGEGSALQLPFGIDGMSSHTNDFKMGTPVSTLPDAWRYRVSTGTGWPGASVL